MAHGRSHHADVVAVEKNLLQLGLVSGVVTDKASEK